MDLLGANYASSDEEAEADKAGIGVHTQQPTDTAHATGAADAPGRPAKIEEEAVRAAIAKRFAERAQRASHRVTTAERRYSYQPYVSKRQMHGAQGSGDKQHRTAPSHKGPNALPLFSTLRALATSIGSSRSLDNKTSSAVTESAEAVPVWQKRRRMQDHASAINSLQWNPRYPPLFLSASMDHSVRVWLLPVLYYDDTTGHSDSDTPQCRRVLGHHMHGVKSAKWAIDGRHIWSGSFDGHAAYVDVERADVVHRFAHHPNEHVTALLPHPTDPQLALIGTDRGRILQRDLRMDASSPPAAIYGTKTTGEILDLLFLPNGESTDCRFVSSSSLTARDTSHQTLLVWDFRSSTLVADHVNNDLCSFTSLCLHPNRRHFAAQSTTSEAIVFSALAPYKRLKPKRSFHSGHDVQGFSVGCSFNSTGSLLASGDVNGRVVLYSGATRRVLKQYQVYDPSTPCLAVAFHPQWASTLISGGYDGRMDLFDLMAAY